MSVKILVVDDEPDLEPLIRQRFRKQIRAAEFEFSFAANGEEALQSLENDPEIDIVLTDINMPQMDGLTLLERLSEGERLLKSVVISAYGDMENIRTAMNRGAFDFLTKPIDFNDLGITIDKTIREVNKIKQGIRARTDLMFVQKELDVAAQIQMSLLPKVFPPFPNRKEVDLFALMVPARQVGGDFYDFFWVDDHRLGFVIGDVAGKGVPAAILMAVTRTLIKATGTRGYAPEECVGHVNRILATESAPEMFVTGIYGVLDTRDGTILMANAGHNLPYLIDTDGNARLLETRGGLVLGILMESVYAPIPMQLTPGETLFLYTDGVTEAMDTQRRLLGEERVAEMLTARGKQGVQVLCEGLLGDINAYAGEAPQQDDVTMLALCYNGPSAK